MKALIYTTHAKLLQFIYHKRKRIPRAKNPQHNILGESLFPDHNSIKLYETVFWSSFNELPKTCQELLLLHWKEYKNTDISALLQIDMDSVTQQKTRCTQRFLKRVMNHQDYPKFTKAT